MSTTTGAGAPPQLTFLLPDGWTRLSLDEQLETRIRDIVRGTLAEVPMNKRDFVQPKLRRLLERAFLPARDRGMSEAWFPVAPTSGIQLPAAVIVGPMPDPPGADHSVQDHLLAFTAGIDGARATEVAGSLAVRLRRDHDARFDDDGNLEAPDTRVISYVVSPGPASASWFTVVASLLVPDRQDGGEILDALELFVDSLVATVMPERAPAASSGLKGTP